MLDNIKILEKSNDHLIFILDNIDLYIANSIRRAIIAEIPTLAIEDVIFYENSSSIHDEFIALRLGLIPLIAKIDEFNFRDKCECNGKGCKSCTAYFKLEAEGPKTVYSHDLKVIEDDRVIVPKNIPIIKLGRKQRLVLEAEAILGRGKDHAKWQAGIAAYKYYPEIRINYERCTLCKNCIEECPRKVLKLEDDKIVLKDVIRCNLCKACEEACPEEALNLNGNEKKLIFKIEVINKSYKPEELFIKACEILKEKAQELKKKLY